MVWVLKKEGTHILTLLTQIKQHVLDVQLLIFLIFMFQFDDKIVDFSGPSAETCTIEDLMGVVIPESNSPSSEPQYTFRLDYAGKGAESNGVRANQDEEGACVEENQLDASVSNPVSKCCLLILNKTDLVNTV